MGSATAACTPPSAGTVSSAATGAAPAPAQDASGEGPADDGLAQLFQDATAEEVAVKLEAMVQEQEAGPDAGRDAAQDGKQVAPPKRVRDIAPRPVYKGVAF